MLVYYLNIKHILNVVIYLKSEISDITIIFVERRFHIIVTLFSSSNGKTYTCLGYTYKIEKSYDIIQPVHVTKYIGTVRKTDVLSPNVLRKSYLSEIYYLYIYRLVFCFYIYIWLLPLRLYLKILFRAIIFITGVSFPLCISIAVQVLIFQMFNYSTAFHHI